ncbi:MAG: phosphoribosylanthranilate isomerase [Prevotella sp.]|nr:phosphoribosylanthranilate isomerase [Prevotella sp.]
MIIKVCGMREPENILAVSRLGVDMIGFIFYPKSSRYVPLQIEKEQVMRDSMRCSSDNVVLRVPRRVGVFVNDTPQNILMRVNAHQLDYVQLHGEETPASIEELKTILTNDNHRDVRFLKALSINNKEDFRVWRDYQGLVDMLLFDTRCTTYGGSGKHFEWSLLDAYDGDIPFLLSGGIGPGDADQIRSIHHPMMAGVDLNSRFESAPAVKNVEKLNSFIQELGF